jgi:uncharacterized protein
MALDYTRQTVLITGASSGIGRAFASALAARGSDLVLVARRAERLDSIAAELREQHGVTVIPVPLDLTRPDVGDALLRAVTDHGVEVTGVINSAGFGTFGPFVEEEPGRLAQEIAVDVAAPVQISATFLPQLVRRGAGFLINVASLAGYTPLPRMAVYGAAKAFVLSFTEALWAETRGTGVTVFALSPGATSTEFNEVVGTEDATSGRKMRTAQDVVATALRQLERSNPGPSVVDGTANRLMAAVGRLGSRRMVATIAGRFTEPAETAAGGATSRPA